MNVEELLVCIPNWLDIIQCWRRGIQPSLWKNHWLPVWRRISVSSIQHWKSHHNWFHICQWCKSDPRSPRSQTAHTDICCWSYWDWLVWLCWSFVPMFYHRNCGGTILCWEWLLLWKIGFIACNTVQEIPFCSDNLLNFTARLSNSFHFCPKDSVQKKLRTQLSASVKQPLLTYSPGLLRRLPLHN